MKYIPLGNQPNVSRTPFEVSSPSMRLDVRGYPHIVWTESKLGKTEINYSYWDGLQWSYKGYSRVSDVVENTVSAKNSLILDDNGSPYIAYAKEGTATVLTLASYLNGWNFNKLSVDYEVGWVGVSYYGGEGFGVSSSSTSSFEGCEPTYCADGFNIVPSINGTWSWTGDYYNAKPVYNNGGSDLLFFDSVTWRIGAYDPFIVTLYVASSATDCPDTDYIFSAGPTVDGVIVEGACSSSSSSVNSVSSSSSSLDSSSTSSSSSYDDKEIVVVVYDETNSMLKIYVVTDTVWRLIGSKSVNIADTNSLIIGMAETQLGVVYIANNVVKYNFFNLDDSTWAFSNFADIASFQGTIIDIDMDAYVYNNTAYICVGCVSTASSLSYISNVVCSYGGVETYYEIETISFDITIPSDYVVGNTDIAVTVNQGNIYQLVNGGSSKIYQGIGAPASLTWDNGEVVSLDCSGNDMVVVATDMKFSDKTKIAVQSDGKDIYFLESDSDSKTITTPSITVLNDKWVFDAEYGEGNLVGNNVSYTYESRCGGILKDTKGYTAVVDSIPNAPSS